MTCPTSEHILTRSEYEKHQELVARFGRKVPVSLQALNDHFAAGGSKAWGNNFKPEEAS